jgi:hypothetical protein
MALMIFISLSFFGVQDRSIRGRHGCSEPGNTETWNVAALNEGDMLNLRH